MVLGGEDGGRHQHRDLLAVLDRLERGAQGDLGLAVADVADDQPVHRPGLLHVRLDLERRAELVDRLLVRERRLHLGLPRRVVGERVAARLGPGGVQLEEVLGQVVDRLADALLGAQPVGAAELGEGRPLAARVAADPGDLLDRHEDPVAAGERQLEVVAVLACATAPEHPLVAGHAVVDVDDEVARRQPLQDVARDDPPERLRPADPDRPEQLAIGDEREAVGPAAEPAVEAALDEDDGAGRRRLAHPAHDRRRAGPPRRAARPGAAPGPRRGRSGRLRLARCRPPRPAVRHGRAAGPARASRTGRPTTARRGPATASSGGTDSQVSSSVREATSRPFQSRGPR